MYRIGPFSKLAKTTVKTLRHYDEVGLLKPAQVDEETGYRYYSSDQLFDLHEIISLRQIGFSIPEVKDILSGHDVSEILEKRRREIESTIDAATDQLFRIAHYISKQEEGSDMNYKPVIKDIDSCIVFSKRQVIPNYDALFELEPTIGKMVTEANPELKCVEPEYCFNIYHDGEHKERDIDVEVCQAVTGYGVAVDGVTFKEMPAITAATVLHRGSYDSLGEAYAFLTNWVEENGYVITAEPRESYIDGVWNKKDPSDWLTEIQFPVAKR